MQEIIGIGTDLTDIRRIEKLLESHKTAFLLKIFTALERQIIESKKNDPNFIAKRWAAKEATIKACSGFITWHEIEITSSANGAPRLRLLGEQHLGKQGFISLTDEYPYAQATVIIVQNRTQSSLNK